MDTPHIYRPKPRRPFETHLALQPPSPSITPSSESLETPSRTHSMLNLTSSTLGGIYSATVHDDLEPETSSTPWGTGAQSPERKRSPPVYRRQQTFVTASTPKSATISSRIFRSILLFGFGLLYGLLVKHLHDDRHLAPLQVESIIKPSHDGRYLIFWGIAGVGLGSLLPLVDKLWEEKMQSQLKKFTGASPDEAIDASNSLGILGGDWILAVRSVGAFVGIAYAIRKLPWASDMQASLTLALVNPVLWYLIDRSKAGLVFSAAVGATGSALLLASNSELLPSPAVSIKNSTESQPADNSEHGSESLVTRGNLEAGIWISSVLFCSCVCFGNIGRRLALNSQTRKASFLKEKPIRKSTGNVQARYSR